MILKTHNFLAFLGGGGKFSTLSQTIFLSNSFKISHIFDDVKGNYNFSDSLWFVVFFQFQIISYQNPN
jgi:hypothetical protein